MLGECPLYVIGTACQPEQPLPEQHVHSLSNKAASEELSPVSLIAGADAFPRMGPSRSRTFAREQTVRTDRNILSNWAPPGV